MSGALIIAWIAAGWACCAPFWLDAWRDRDVGFMVLLAFLTIFDGAVAGPFMVVALLLVWRLDKELSR